MIEVTYKPGDRVRVVRSVLEESGWDNVWVEEMYAAIGNVYTVERSDDSGVWFVEPIDRYNYGFPKGSIELESITILQKDIDTRYINLNFQKVNYPIKCVQAFEYSGEVFSNESDARKAALVDMLNRILGSRDFSTVQLQKIADKSDQIKEAFEQAYA